MIGPLATIAAVAFSTCAIAAPLGEILRRWFEPDSFYTHGPVIPFVLAYFLIRGAPSPIAIEPTERAVILPSAVTLAGCLAAAVGFDRLGIHFLASFAAIAAAIPLALLLLGARPRWFVDRHKGGALLLLAMVPLPSYLLSLATIHLRELSTQGAVWVLARLLPHLAREGHSIVWGTDPAAPQFEVVMTDACSGLQTTLSMLIAAGVLGLLARDRRVGAALLISATPLALVSNVIRVVVFALGIQAGFSGFLNGPAHEWMGAATFAMGFLLLLALAAALPKSKSAHVSNDRTDWKSWTAALKRNATPRLGLTLFLAATPAMALQISNRSNLPASADAVAPQAADLPSDPLGWVSVDVLPDDIGELAQIYGTSRLAMRAYNLAGEGAWDEQSGRPDDSVFVLRAEGSTGIRVAHPPELCFRAEGYTLGRGDTVELAHGLEATRVEAASEETRLWIYYWYELGTETTASFLTHQLHALFARWNHVPTQRLFRLTAEIPNDDPDGGKTHERVLRFSREALQALRGLRP